jgi:hypothetical protein
MANKMQREVEASGALVDGERGELAPVELPNPAEERRRPYSPPRLRSLGKVAELTFGGIGSKIDGIRKKKG